jgi:hypothetical protein
MNHSRHQGDQRTLWSEGTNRAHSLSLAYYPCELAYVVTPYVQTTPSFTNLCLDRPHYILNEYTLQNENGAARLASDGFGHPDHRGFSRIDPDPDASPREFIFRSVYHIVVMCEVCVVYEFTCI